MLSAFTPSEAALARNHRMAAFTSWICAGHGASGVSRYSTATQVKPRFASAFAWGGIICLEPMRQPPPWIISTPAPLACSGR